MKRQFILILLLILCIHLLYVPAFASENSEAYITEQLDQISDELEEQIPTETQDLLEDLNLSELNFQQILALDSKEFLVLLKEQMIVQWQEPQRIIGRMLGILLISALLFPLRDTIIKQQSAMVVTLSSSLCLCSILLPSIFDCITACMKSLQHCANFLIALIPILTALLTVSGRLASAGIYQLLLFAACQLISQLTVTVAAPLLNVYTAVGAVSSIFPNLNVHGFINGLKSVICWGLGIVTTLFVAFLSLQTFVTSNLDVVTQKTSRFLMGSFIPVVGTILSDALGAAKGCIGLIQSTAGTFGIIVSLWIILPSLLQAVLWYIVTWLGLQLSTFLPAAELSQIFKISNNSFAILIALQACMLLTVVVSLSLIIVIGTGG